MKPERWRRRGYSIAEMRELARRELPRPVFDFADGGAEDERTLRRNEAFARSTLLPRPLNGAASATLVELFGRRLSMPVIIGPTGLAGLFWPSGETLPRGPPPRPARPIASATARSARSRRFPTGARRAGCRSSSQGSRLHARAGRAGRRLRL